MTTQAERIEAVRARLKEMIDYAWCRGAIGNERLTTIAPHAVAELAERAFALGVDEGLKRRNRASVEDAVTSLRVQANSLKHAPHGRGGFGPCDPDCLKCWLLAEITKLEGSPGSR